MRNNQHSIAAALGVALGLTLFATTPAPAQGLFQALFGAPPQRSAPPRVGPTAYADPAGESGMFGGPVRSQPRAPVRSSSTGGGGGGGIAFCVRTCDGRYFPMARHRNATPVQLCNAFCPTAETKVFHGSTIDHAVARDGTRYASLKNAFVYRERLVDGCTCNGKDALGLTRIDLADDPTLRAGDIVATNEGLVAYSVGRPSRRGHAAVDSFTPVESYSGLSRDLRAQLANTQVAPSN